MNANMRASKEGQGEVGLLHQKTSFARTNSPRTLLFTEFRPQTTKITSLIHTVKKNTQTHLRQYGLWWGPYRQVGVLDRSSRFCKFHLNVFLRTIPNELGILLWSVILTLLFPNDWKTSTLFYPDLAIATSPQLHSSLWRRVQYLFAPVALGNVCRTLAFLYSSLGI